MLYLVLKERDCGNKVQFYGQHITNDYVRCYQRLKDYIDHYILHNKITFSYLTHINVFHFVRQNKI